MPLRRNGDAFVNRQGDEPSLPGVPRFSWAARVVIAKDIDLRSDQDAVSAPRSSHG